MALNIERYEYSKVRAKFDDLALTFDPGGSVLPDKLIVPAPDSIAKPQFGESNSWLSQVGQSLPLRIRTIHNTGELDGKVKRPLKVRMNRTTRAMATTIARRAVSECAIRAGELST